MFSSLMTHYRIPSYHRDHSPHTLTTHSPAQRSPTPHALSPTTTVSLTTALHSLPCNTRGVSRHTVHQLGIEAELHESSLASLYPY